MTNISVFPRDRSSSFAKAGIVYVVGDMKEPMGIIMDNADFHPSCRQSPWLTEQIPQPSGIRPNLSAV